MKAIKQTRQLLNLFEKAKNGDNNAFSKIYNTYFSSIYRYLFFQTKTKEDAEDLTQKVFLKSFSNLKNGEKNINNPNYYFFRIAKNSLIDYWRKKKEVYLENDEKFKEIHDDKENIEGNFSKLENMKDAKKYILSLPPKKRQVIILKYLCDLNNKEISDLLKMKEPAVRKNQSIGLKLLRKNYE